MAGANAPKEIVQVPAQVINMNPRQDGSWKLTFETRELSGDDVKLLAETLQGEGWLVFKPNSTGIIPEEVPDSDADSGIKSQSRRLRDVVFILWKQQGGKGDFESFKRVYFEKLIEYTKSKLDSEET